MTIHFICRGNGFRSRIAETYVNSLERTDLKTISSGTVADSYRYKNDPICAHTKVVLSKHNLLKYDKNKCDQLTQSRINPNDVTVCINEKVFLECKSLVTLPQNVIVWDVDDLDEHFINNPSVEEINEYSEEVFQTIKNNVDHLLASLEQ